MEQLQRNGYVVTSMVYSTATCWVYKGKHPGCLNCTPEVAIKIQSFSSQAGLMRAYREIENQGQLQHHPNVVQLFEYYYEQTSDNKLLLYLVMEWVEKDLMKDVDQRRTHNYPWCEVELNSIACDLIKVLAEAERLQICHRDIKPQNIFYNPITKSVKLGDFGSSAAGLLSEVQDCSVVGTPFYMSEELKLGLLTSSTRITHNAVKSDVYALGVTLLVLAELRAPVSLMTHNDALLQNEIGALPYSDCLKGMIWNMLNPDVEQRYTFEQLEREYVLVLRRRSQSADLPLQFAEENPCGTGGVQSQEQIGPGCEPVYPEEDLNLRHSHSVEVPQYAVVAQQPYEAPQFQRQEYPCHQPEYQVPNQSCIQDQRNQIGVYFENPIPTAVWKSDADLCCIQCSKEMSVISKTQAIVIRCVEGHTMNYCTRACFIEHVESVTREYTKDFVCFRCGQSISQERIIPLYGGMERFATEKAKLVQKEFMCVACEETLATHTLEKCGHIYCKRCANAVRILLKMKYTCKICNMVSHKKHKLSKISFWKKKPTAYMGQDRAKAANLI